MDRRTLGRTGLEVGVLSFGAFKIGRNEGAKYPDGYELPSDEQVRTLLDGVLDLGIDLIDTAPAYGTSEARIGETLASRRDAFRICTKVGETFADGHSTYDFSSAGIRRSMQASLDRLNTDQVDLLLVHSDGNDLDLVDRSEVVDTLIDLRSAGLARFIGFSGKTVEGNRTALRWADAIMVEYHLDDRSHEDLIHEAAEAGVGVLVKKALASGRLDAKEAIPFVLAHPGVTSVVIGGLSLDHLRDNVAIACSR